MTVAGFLYYSNRTSSPAPAMAIASMLFAVGLTFVIIAAIMVWSSRVTKPKVIDRILDSIPWRGDETVLDVGCGRGLFLIAAAQRLKTGKATGVDIYELSGADLPNTESPGLRVVPEDGGRALPVSKLDLLAEIDPGD